MWESPPEAFTGVCGKHCSAVVGRIGDARHQRRGDFDHSSHQRRVSFYDPVVLRRIQGATRQ
jgi:hypothetical protein